jgi:hypothetical protein
MLILKKGKTFWIEYSRDEEGDIFYIHRFQYEDGFTCNAFAKTRSKEKAIAVFTLLEGL